LNLNKEYDFQEIYNQFKVLVYNVALNYVQNIEDAEEITQDVFVKINGSLDKFNNNSTLKTWIYRITINECLDFIKKKNSKKRFFIFGNKLLIQNSLFGQHSPDSLSLQINITFDGKPIILGEKYISKKQDTLRWMMLNFTFLH
jgi:DNA-directed RNA polymerase specialized sigma24 family protein